MQQNGEITQDHNTDKRYEYKKEDWESCVLHHLVFTEILLKVKELPLLPVFHSLFSATDGLI